MEVLLFDDYISNVLPEGFDNSVFDNPEFDIDTIDDEMLMAKDTKIEDLEK